MISKHDEPRVKTLLGSEALMTRVKRSVHARKKRRATLALAKGYRGDASRHYKTAKEAVLKADQYRYRDRRNRKRDFRRLWITRINAAARQNGMSYSQFMHGLQLGRRRARPQDPRGHRRPRRRHLPTLCRPRPRGAGGRLSHKPNHQHRHPGAAPPGGRPFSFMTRSPAPTTRSSRRSASSGCAAATRERAGRFVAEGEDLLAAADAAGWQPVERFCAAGSGLPGIEVEPQLLAPALRAWTRARGRSRCTRSGGRRSPPGRCASTCTASTIPATSARSCARREAFGASCVAIGPGTADPYGPKAVRASMGAIFGVPLARARDRRSRELPGRPTIALVRRAAARPNFGAPVRRVRSEPPNFAASDDLTLLIGAERDGLPDDVIAARRP